MTLLASAPSALARFHALVDPLVAKIVAASPMMAPVAGFVLGNVVPAIVLALFVEWLVFRAGFRSPLRRLPRKERFWAALLVGGVVLRVAMELTWRGPMDLLYSDATRHYDNAKRFLDPGPQGCSNPYLYQLFLFLVLRFTGGAKLGISLVNLALSLSYPFFWYRFARTVLRRRIDALRCATVLIYLPTHVVMFSYFMNETLLLPLLGAALWATSVAGRRRSGARFLVAALLWVCAILTRSVVLPASVMALGWCLHRLRFGVVAALVTAGVLVGSALAAVPVVAGGVDAVMLKQQLPLLGAAAAGFLVLATLACASWPRSRILPVLGAWAILAGGLGVAAQHSFKHLRRYTPFGDNTVVAVYFASGAAGYRITYVGGGTYGFGSPSLYISPFDPFFEWRSSRWKSKCPDGLKPWPKYCQGKTPKEREAMVDTEASTFAFVVDPKLLGADVKKTLLETLVKNRAILPRLVFENLVYTSFSHSWPDSGKESGSGLLCLWERWILVPPLRRLHRQEPPLAAPEPPLPLRPRGRADHDPRALCVADHGDGRPVPEAHRADGGAVPVRAGALNGVARPAALSAPRCRTGA